MNTKNIKLPLLFSFLLVLIMTSCQDKKHITYVANVPVTQSLEDWRNAEFSLVGPRDLERPGKIYIYGTFLFVNEYLQGVHFFDNSNPASPVNLGFLPVLANVDIAVKDNKMYLDSYFDLLTFDINDIMNPTIVDREEDVFTFFDYAYFPSYNPDMPMASFDTYGSIVTEWVQEETTEEVDNDYYYNYAQFDLMTFNSISSESGSSGTSFLSGAGKAGSTARFALYEDNLYTLESGELGVFTIGAQTDFVRDVQMRWTAETLFPAQDMLFIGTTTGMIIYDLGTPSNPQFVSEYSHWTGCDPVVVDGNRAYVTLATGRTCWGNSNVLHVLDISNLNNPTLIKEYEMINPGGLGVDGELLFLCDGGDGLKVYDRTDDHTIVQNRLGHFANINSSDVIPWNGTLIMTASEGIFQYDYSNPTNVVQISLIPAN